MLPNSQALIDRLPHRGAMRLVDAVLRVEPAEVETMTYFDDKRTWMLDAEGYVPSYVGIEMVAQSAAIGLMRGRSEAEALQGVIVQVKAFEASGRRMKAEVPLQTICSVETHLEGAVVAVSGTVRCGAQALCSVSLTLSVHA